MMARLGWIAAALVGVGLIACAAWMAVRPPDPAPPRLGVDGPHGSMPPAQEVTSEWLAETAEAEAPVPFEIGPVAPAAQSANDRILGQWRQLQRGRLSAPPPLPSPAITEPAGEWLVFHGTTARPVRIHVQGPLTDQLGRLRAPSGVTAVVENLRLSTFALPPTRLGRLQWPLQNRYCPGVDLGWADVAGTLALRALPVVGLVDAALDVADPRLAESLLPNARELAGNGIDDDGNGLIDDRLGFNFVLGSAEMADGGAFEHGTFIASILASRPAGGRDDLIGLCPQVRLVAAVALRADGSAPDPWRAEGDLAAVLEAIEYVVARGARVVNCSFGAPVTAEQLERLNRLPLWDRLERQGVLLVCAAGNDRLDLDRQSVFPACLPRPNVLSVMAADAEGRPGRAWDERGRQWREFSNYGARSVDLAAPGTLILGIPRRGEVAMRSGTSCAAAFASGVAAMVWARHPDLSPAELIEQLVRTCRPSPALAGQCRSGGMVSLDGLAGPE